MNKISPHSFRREPVIRSQKYAEQVTESISKYHNFMAGSFPFLYQLPAGSYQLKV